MVPLLMMMAEEQLPPHHIHNNDDDDDDDGYGKSGGCEGWLGAAIDSQDGVMCQGRCLYKTYDLFLLFLVFVVVFCICATLVANYSQHIEMKMCSVFLFWATVK